MNRVNHLVLTVFALCALLSVSASAEDNCLLQSFDCLVNVLHAERHWISPLDKSPAEPNTWLKPERLVTHLTVEISNYQRRPPVDKPDHAPYIQFIENNAKQLIVGVSVSDGRKLTPYVNRNGTLKAPLKLKAILYLSKYSAIPGVDPNKIHILDLGVLEILPGTSGK